MLLLLLLSARPPDAHQARRRAHLYGLCQGVLPIALSSCCVGSPSPRCARPTGGLGAQHVCAPCNGKGTHMQDKERYGSEPFKEWASRGPGQTPSKVW